MARAREFLAVSQMALDEHDSAEPGYIYSSAAASLAILAGIAASDAACCEAIGRRSRAESHQAASKLLGEILPGGKSAARDLALLIGLKDRAQYGAMALKPSELKRVLRRAESLCEFAETVLRR